MYSVLSEMNSTGINGVPVDLKTIVNDNLLSYVEGLNPNLGTAGDDYYDKFRQFIETIGSREFDIIQVNDIAANEYKTFDLQGDENNVAILLITDFLKDLKNNLSAKFLEDCTIVESENLEYYKPKSPSIFSVRDRYNLE